MRLFIFYERSDDREALYWLINVTSHFFTLIFNQIRQTSAKFTNKTIKMWKSIINYTSYCTVVFRTQGGLGVVLGSGLVLRKSGDILSIMTLKQRACVCVCVCVCVGFQPTPPPPPVATKQQYLCQPLLDAVMANIRSPVFNHSLYRTFAPAMTAIHGPPITYVPTNRFT